MPVLRGWLRRSWPERWALAEAVLLLTGARAALAVFSFPAVLARAQRLGRSGGSSSGSEAAEARLARRLRAVRVVGRYLFARGPCLPQALVAQVLVRRAGRDADLRIGTRREPGGAVEAHAWVESDGRVVMGDLDDLDSYVPLAPARFDGA